MFSRDSYTLLDELNHCPVLQDRMFHVLATLYGFVAVVAMVQSIMIERRVPEYRWTTQKIFHLSIFLVNAARCVIYIYRHDIQHLTPKITQHIVLDLPSLVYFSTYDLLVLFWSEIYYQTSINQEDGQVKDLLCRPTILWHSSFYPNRLCLQQGNGFSSSDKVYKSVLNIVTKAQK
nr:tobamovirus multiplication protein 3-like [Tanacetum cinerariifolium]